jgi:hypothetical protein
VKTNQLYTLFRCQKNLDTPNLAEAPIMAKKGPDSVEPKFPYTNEPNSLRRLLAEIPKRPKPPKVTLETLKAWGVSNSHGAQTAINVLKKIGLLGQSGEPTNIYVEFMKTGSGPAALAERIKDTYRVLFESSHAPQNDTPDEMKKLFHIHSGGGEEAMRLQVQTFKALSEHANFSAAEGGSDSNAGGSSLGAEQPGGTNQGTQRLPPIQVDLHIHLPENKTTRDYEAIIQDIAKYIYGRDIEKA